MIGLIPELHDYFLLAILWKASSVQLLGWASTLMDLRYGCYVKTRKARDIVPQQYRMKGCTITYYSVFLWYNKVYTADPARQCMYE